MGGPSGRKRGRKKRKKANRDEQRRRNEIEASAPYRGVSFRARPSSGRPGTPHRYFESSYDAHFDGGSDGGVGDVGETTPSEPAVAIDPGDGSGEPRGERTGCPDGGARGAVSGGRQVVHRHLNGLCIVTAGDVFDSIRVRKNDGEGGGGDAEAGHDIGIASVEYLVRPGEDAQSARGKIRSMNKRHKRTDGGRGDGGGEGDGRVSPRDPLCRIVLTDGTEVRLRCCVSGTVIEVNSRLSCSGDAIEGAGLREDESDSYDDDDEGNDGEGSKGGSVDRGTALGGGDPSLLLRDPLLDGHLAVIMPAWGAFPPRENGQQKTSGGQPG